MFIAGTTEFKAISLVGVVAALMLSLWLWRQGPRVLSWITLAISVAGLFVYLAGYGIG